MKDSTNSQELLGWKKWVGLSLIVLGSISFFFALSATWLTNSIFTQENFVSTTKTVLLSDSSRDTISNIIVDTALEDRPTVNRLIGNQATSLVNGLLGSDLFSNIFDTVANKTYTYLTTADRSDVAIDLTAIKTPLSGIVSFAENRGREVSFDPTEIPDRIVLVESDEVPNVSGYIQLILVLNGIFWLFTLACFSVYLFMQKQGKIRRAYHLCLAAGIVAIAGLITGPFIPPAVASFVSLVEARVIVTELVSAFLVQFAPLLWTTLGVAALVALCLGLRKQAKRGVVFVTSKISGTSSKPATTVSKATKTTPAKKAKTTKK